MWSNLYVSTSEQISGIVDEKRRLYLLLSGNGVWGMEGRKAIYLHVEKIAHRAIENALNRWQALCNSQMPSCTKSKLNIVFSRNSNLYSKSFARG